MQSVFSSFIVALKLPYILENFTLYFRELNFDMTV